MDEEKLGNIVFKMLAKFYQNFLLPKMATKEDLEGRATKEDLKKKPKSNQHHLLFNF